MADIILLGDDQESHVQWDGPRHDYDDLDDRDPRMVDDKSDRPLARIQKFAGSTRNSHRVETMGVLGRIIKNGLTAELEADLPAIFSIISKLAANDKCIVRAHILEAIPLIAKLLVESNEPKLALAVGDHFLPIIVQNLESDEIRVKSETHAALLQLMKFGYITKFQAEIQVCPAILASVQNTKQDYYGTVITLMTKMVHWLGTDATERVFLDRFAELCTSPLNYVKKICAYNLGDFGAGVTKQAFDRVLLPRYVDLCKDDIWRIRKECAEIILKVSCLCTLEQRRTVLTPVLVSFLNDKNTSVRMSAFQCLGAFIATFAVPAVISLTHNTDGDVVVVNSQGGEFTLFVSLTRVLYSIGEKFECDDDDNNWDWLINEPLEQEEQLPDLSCDLVREKESVQENESNSKTDELKPVLEGADPPNENCIGNYFFVQNSEDIVYNYDNNTKTEEKPTQKSSQIHTDCSLGEEETGKSELISRKGGCSSEEDKVEVKCTIARIYSENLKECQTNIDSDNDLDLYNNYNYWYISPEMPLDPLIINGSSSPSSGDNLADKKNVPLLNTSICSSTTDSSTTLNTTYTLEGDVKVESGNQEKPPEKPKEPEQDIVPQTLIDYYISMTDPKVAQSNYTDMTYHCAYSLPAVVLTLGTENFHLLKSTINTLVEDVNYKVRRILASSLHELATILGPEIATQHLLPMFDWLIRDEDEVRIGVLKHLAQFLELVKPLQRSRYVSRLIKFLDTDNNKNWRFRLQLAEQLTLVVHLFSPDDSAKRLGKIASLLLADKVSAVRESSIVLFSELLKYIQHDYMLSQIVLARLTEQFAHSRKWKLRQTFALLCSEILKNKSVSNEVFSSDVMPHLLDLSWDPVPNVRLVVARIISKHIITNDYFADESNLHKDSLDTVLRRLQSDKDPDVRQSAEIA